MAKSTPEPIKAGPSTAAIAGVIVAIAIILSIFVWKVVDSYNTQNSATDESSQVDTTQPIEDDSDLNATDEDLENTDIEGSDTSDLDAQTEY